MNEQTVYNNDFYSRNLKSQSDAAHGLITALKRWISPRSVIDIGCGVGHILSQWLKHGAEEIMGVDGDYVDRSLLALPNECFIPHDLTKPFPVTRRFALAMCFEVVEHLDQSCAEMLIRLLCDLSDVVAFSASIPTQGSELHINEHYPSYWEKLFLQNGYCAVDCIREEIWTCRSIDYFYRQNLILYVKNEKLRDYPALYEYKKTHPGSVMDLVHPELWDEYREMTKLQARWYMDPKLLSIREAARNRRIVCWGTGFYANCMRFYFARMNFAPDILFVDGRRTVPVLKDMPITPLEQIDGEAANHYVVISTLYRQPEIVQKLEAMGYGENDYCWFIE